MNVQSSFAAATYSSAYSLPMTRTSRGNGAGTLPRIGQVDTVEISDFARQQGQTVPVPVNLSEESALGGVSSRGLKQYANIGFGPGQTSLEAMNANRKSIGSRIESILRANGVQLGKNEKIAISIDGNNNIVVSGLKDKNKAAAIQEALNNDDKLARDMRRHAALGAVNAAAKRQEAAEASEMPGDAPDLFTNRAVRAFMVDDYLRQYGGTDLSMLSLEKDKDGNEYIAGMTDELTNLLVDDAPLGETLTDILKNNEQDLPFEASFEYANGAIADAAADSAAKDKVESVKAILMGGYNPQTHAYEPGLINDVIDLVKDTDVEQEFMKALQGFSIRVSASGEIELVGLDNLDDHLTGALLDQVKKALLSYAGGEALKNQPELSGIGATREQDFDVTASFADVAGVMIEQHKFEHGDTDEFVHMVEINLGSGEMKVVSPDADKAQDEKNAALATDLGESLRTMLQEEGVDTSNLELEIDETGHITVQGDPRDPNTAMAQSLVDQFVKEAKSLTMEGQAAEDDEENPNEAAVDTDDYANQLGVVAVAEKDDVPEDNEFGYRLADFPKYDTSVFRTANVGWTSDATPTWAGGTTTTTFRLAGEGSQARKQSFALYGELMDGMANFHDKRRVTYRMGSE